MVKTNAPGGFLCVVAAVGQWQSEEGSQRFGVQLNLNWFVFFFFLSFKEVALQRESRQTGARRTLRRDGGSLSQNSSCIYNSNFGFAPGLVGPGESEENLGACH